MWLPRLCKYFYKGDISCDASSTSSCTRSPTFEKNEPHEHAISQPVGSTSSFTRSVTFENSQSHDHALSQPVGTSSKWAKYSAVVNN